MATQPPTSAKPVPASADELLLARSLPQPLQPYVSDEKRFEHLTEGLTRASMPHLARAVRDERAGLPIPAAAFYTSQMILKGEHPVYLTTPLSGGTGNSARRYTLDRLRQRPPSSVQNASRPSTANYSSPYLLKHFAPGAAPESREGPMRATGPGSAATRPATAAESARWHKPMDVHANTQVYDMRRSLAKGADAALPQQPAAPSDVLDVDAERIAAAERQVRELSLSSGFAVCSPAVEEAGKEEGAGGGNSTSNDAEGEAPPSPAGTPPQPVSTPERAAGSRRARAQGDSVASLLGGGGLGGDGGKQPPSDPSTDSQPRRSTRRSVGMQDAASFYGVAANRLISAAREAPPSTPPAEASARARAHEQSRSDIFGHSIPSRGHFSLRPAT